MQKKFIVFGEPAELVVSSDMTGGAFSICRETTKPGGGPPPHVHQLEDEVFSVVSGRFEIFDGEGRTEIPKDGVIFAPRGKVHCFRNCGDVDGMIQFINTGNRFDVFFEGLSRFTLPEDLQAMVDYSVEFGISYPTLPPPTGK